MPLNTENIEHLVFKFNNGSISPEELQILMDWYNSHDDEQVIIPSTTDESHDVIKSRMLAQLLSKVGKDRVQLPLKIRFKARWITAAAAAILIVAFGTWMVLEYNTPVGNSEHVQTSIEPGGNKATLTLSNGRTIQLKNSQAGIVAGEKITYTDGSPVENTAAGQSADAQKLLSLHTPRGGTYKIILPDGSQVWLNAQSTIKYPLHFNAEERIVELEGEAFFQVKSIFRTSGEKIPFKVISKQQEVEVLGTQFNMNAYAGQVAGKTTLVEGKVAVRGQQGRFILKPNEQAITTMGKTTVKSVNPANYTAWRDGKFSFDGKTFEETMNDIGRWYDLDIVYDKEIPKEELVGDAFRNQNISLVLRLLDVAEIDYSLDVLHRKLTIKGKKNRM